MMEECMTKRQKGRRIVVWVVLLVCLCAGGVCLARMRISSPILYDRELPQDEMLDFLQCDHGSKVYQQEIDMLLEITDIKSTKSAGEEAARTEAASQKRGEVQSNEATQRNEGIEGNEAIQRNEPENSDNNSEAAQPSELRKYLDEHSSTTEITVAIIDTGLQLDAFSKPERVIGLPEKVPEYWSGYVAEEICDRNGHGTRMAEIVAQNSNANVRILPIPAADESGKATVLQVCSAIRLATELEADIVNLSMNTLQSKQSVLLDAEIERAVSAGVMVVVSAGNRSMDTSKCAPADSEGAIVVSAADAYGDFAEYSNYGKTVDYCAPGSYGEYAGTSYAAAYVTGVLADAMSRGLCPEDLQAYLYEKGELGRDDCYGLGLISLEVPKDKNLIEDIFGTDEWEETEAVAKNPIDIQTMTNAQINAWVAVTDLAEVGQYISQLPENKRMQLLERDTVLKQKVWFCEKTLSGEEAAAGEDISLTSQKEYFYYEKCLEIYEEEAEILRTSAQYLHKTGHFKLEFVDETGSGLSTVYEIHARVCLKGKKLDGSALENGAAANRNIFTLGSGENQITVWSTVASGNRDTMHLRWIRENGAYAYFRADDAGGAGRIFVPNLFVINPAYTLMYAKDSTHAHGGSNCAGRSNFFRYSESNQLAASYSAARTFFRPRKFNMSTEPVAQNVSPQINASHMSLSDTSRKLSSTSTVCRMTICLNNPVTTLKVDPNGEKWAGKQELTTLQVVNTRQYELGKTTVTNYSATFYGGGDVLDPVADQTVISNKAFDHWELNCQANGSGKVKDGDSYMSGTTFVAGAAEYDKDSEKAATTGQKVTAKAIFSGSMAITFPAAPYRNGYTFEGWYTGAAPGGGVTACTKENAGTATTVLDSDQEFHARWSKKSYTVSFYNGEDLLSAKEYAYRTNIDLSVSERIDDGIGVSYVQRIHGQETITLSRGAYIFVGWAYAPGGPVVSGVTVPANNDLRLYAVWSMPTSGMRQVVLKLKSGDSTGGGAIPTEGKTPQINLTLGLKAYLYEINVPLTVAPAGVVAAADGSSYAEDNAGNKTLLMTDHAEVELPDRYTFLYQFYVYDAATGQWNYLENQDRQDCVDLFPDEAYTYTYRLPEQVSIPEGYAYHHAAYDQTEVALPYELSVTASRSAEKRLFVVGIFFYPRSCTVTYMACGGQILPEGLGDSFTLSEDRSSAKQQILLGAPLGSLPGVEMGDFYNCNGFFDREHGGRQVQSSDIVQGDMTVYAQWEAKSGLVRYDAGTNRGTIAGQAFLDTEVKYRSAIPHQEYTAKRQGYQFLGWSKQAQELPEKKQAQGLPMDKPVEVILGTEELLLDAQSVTLYAQFQRELQVVFHQWNGQDYGIQEDGKEPVLYNCEKEIEIISPYIEAYDGWTPLGWNNETKVSEQFTVGEGVCFTVEDDEDYYALYYRDVTVHYDTRLAETVGENEVFFDETDVKKAYHSTSGLADAAAQFVIKPGPKQPYYTFLYWMGDDGRRYEPGEEYASVWDLNLHAVWSANTANIIYDASSNGGTVQGQSSVNVAIAYRDQIPTASDCYTAYKENYEFIGWNTKKNAKTAMTEPIYVDEKIMDDGVLTLYAIYRRTLTAEFYQQGEPDPQKVVGILYNNDAKITIQAPRVIPYDGWEELGWSREKAAVTRAELCSLMNYELSEDVTFYAVFQKRVKLEYQTQLYGVEVEPCYGYTYHSSISPKHEQDLPASFLAAGMGQQPGRSFLHWKDERGKAQRPGDMISIFKDEVLLAEWDEYPQIKALDRYFTLEQATDAQGRYINEQSLLDKRYVRATDREDDDETLVVELVDFPAADFMSLKGNASLLVQFSVTDSYGNRAVAYATVHVTDTREKREGVTRTIRFISPDYYKNAKGYVPQEQGGLHEESLWRSDAEYAHVLENAMEQVGAKKKCIRSSHTFSMQEIRLRKELLYSRDREQSVTK